MTIFAISDTHFGHDKLVELSGRPPDFGARILADVRSRMGDLLIHCGDFCIGNDKPHTEAFMEAAKGFKRKVLVRGNHDPRGDLWYMNHGWDFVVNSFVSKYNGKVVVFTHAPILKKNGMDFNVHGHLHGNQHRHEAMALAGYDTTFHKDLAPEIHNYKLVDLTDLIK